MNVFVICIPKVETPQTVNTMRTQNYRWDFEVSLTEKTMQYEDLKLDHVVLTKKKKSLERLAFLQCLCSQILIMK